MCSHHDKIYGNLEVREKIEIVYCRENLLCTHTLGWQQFWIPGRHYLFIVRFKPK